MNSPQTEKVDSVATGSSHLAHIAAFRSKAQQYGALAVWVSVAALIIAGMLRFARAPSFWLDEAWIAVTLKDPTFEAVFSRLPRGLAFPRIYLLALAGFRSMLGYEIWVLRLVPLFCFITATVLWGLLLIKRSKRLATGLIAGSLLLGGSFWLEQSIQLKQYSWDVMLALIPFVVGDKFLEEAFVEGHRKALLALLAVPLCLSYTYPLIIAPRLIGWYLYHLRKRGWRLHPASLFAFGTVALTALVSLYITDYQINLQDRAALISYWQPCILLSQLQLGFGSAMRVVGDFLWGWHHGRLMPLVVLAIIPLQFSGLCGVVSRLMSNADAQDCDSWGSRSLGSVGVLVAVILASLFASYPICAGRLTLFAQAHTQLLTLDGALLALKLNTGRKPALIFLSVTIVILGVYSTHRYVTFVRSAPVEDLRPILPIIRSEIANSVWVHPCSIAQVRSLPAPLPVDNVLMERSGQSPPRGSKVWVIWTNLSDEYCRVKLDEVRSEALTWSIVHEGPGLGLALAQF